MFTLLFRLLRFLFTSLPGTAIVAGVGLLFVCGGCCGGLFSDPEKEPTTMTVAELEAKSEPPKQQWLQLKDGCLVWSEAQSLTLKKKDRKGNVTDEKVKTVFVPLVSKAAFDEWQGKGGRFPFGKVRVYVKMDGDEFDRNVPQNDPSKIPELVEKMKTPGEHIGLAGALSSEESAVVKGLTDLASGVTAKQILVLRRGERPPTRGESIFAGVCLSVFGLLLFVPLAVALVRRKRGQPADGAAPAAGATSARDALAGAAMAGFERGVRDAVGDAVRRGIEAARQEPRPAPPPPPAPAPRPAPVAIPAGVQFYYLRNGQRYGPVSLAVLRNLYRAGELRSEDLVWHEGAKDWMPASSSPYLKG
jgi:hypothetical protein